MRRALSFSTIARCAARRTTKPTATTTHSTCLDERAASGHAHADAIVASSPLVQPCVCVCVCGVCVCVFVSVSVCFCVCLCAYSLTSCHNRQCVCMFCRDLYASRAHADKGEVQVNLHVRRHFRVPHHKCSMFVCTCT